MEEGRCVVRCDTIHAAITNFTYTMNTIDDGGGSGVVGDGLGGGGRGAVAHVGSGISIVGHWGNQSIHYALRCKSVSERGVSKQTNKLSHQIQHAHTHHK